MRYHAECVSTLCLGGDLHRAVLKMTRVGVRTRVMEMVMTRVRVRVGVRVRLHAVRVTLLQDCAFKLLPVV